MGRVSILRLAVGFSLAFALLLAISILGVQQNAALLRDAALVGHTHEVLARLAALAGTTDLAVSSAQLARLTRDPSDRAAAEAALGRVSPLLTDLRVLISDDAGQAERLDQLAPLIERQVGALGAALAGADRPSDPALTAEIDTWIQRIERVERALLEERIARSLMSARRTELMIFSGYLLGLTIGAATAIVTIRALRLRDTTLGELASLNTQLDARVQQQTGALRTANSQLATLSQQLIATQESERGAVATTLHEAIGQDIAALQLTLQLVEVTSSDPQLRAQVDAGLTAIDRVLDRVRALSFDLRPAALDDFGLPEALRATLAAQLASHSHISYTIDAAQLPVRPSAAVETACFRIAQDAVALLSCGPGTHALSIQLAERDGALALTIRGDGCPAADGPLAAGSLSAALEVLELRERAAVAGGTLTVSATAEHGTAVAVSFPLADHAR